MEPTANRNGTRTDAREVERAREIARLQQRALALETEIAHREELERSLREALAERERIEASLRASKEAAETASRAKSDFLAVMSHELRTPLHSILGFHGLLALGVEGSEREPYLNGIERGATELLGLIDQVLNLSTLEGGHVVAEREPVDLVGVAQEAGRLIAPSAVGKGLVLALDLPKGPFICQTDGDKLRQILVNLLSNAVKFTETGTVGCELEIEPDFACFRVRDTGVGILPTDLDRIFDPFTQTDTPTTRTHRGTGLGLSISRNLARLLGGELGAESRPGEGSVFSLRIPRDPAALRAT